MINIDLVSCDYCGHLQTLQSPIIYEKQLSSASYVSDQLLQHRLEQAQKTFAYASETPCNILEVGCGDGHFLERLAAMTNSVVGVEPSRMSARRARERGLMIEETLVDEETKIPRAPFDAFFSFHVLEHVPSIIRFLRGIRKNLSLGAVGCVEVPSTEAAFEKNRYGDFMPDHMSYFFSRTLRMSLELGGFDVLDLERNWAGEHLVAYVKVRRERLQEEVGNWVSSTTDKLTKFLKKAKKDREKVAMWGASHHILPVLGQIPHDLLPIIVDVSTTKQGRYTPGSHILVEAPSALADERVDYVIVTAPRFQAEIHTALEELLPGKAAKVEADIGVSNSYLRLKW